MSSKFNFRKDIIISFSVTILLIFVSCSNKSHEEELANLRKQIKEYRIENERLLIQNRMLKHKFGLIENPPDSSMEENKEKSDSTNSSITPIKSSTPTPTTDTAPLQSKKLDETEKKDTQRPAATKKTAYVRKPVQTERQEIKTDDNYQFTKTEFNKTFLNRTENEVLRVLGAPNNREKIDKRIVLHYPADCIITQGSIKYKSIQIVLLDSLVEYINFY